MTPQRVFKIEKVPKGSHLEKYLKELPEVFNGKKAEILTYLKKMFVECLDFSKQNAGFSYLPQIILKFVTDHEEYKKSEQAESQKAITREESKLQSNAFTVGNRYTARIYVDLESFVDLLKHGWGTFVLNFVETCFHEILHTAFPQKSEQEVHDQQCLLIETFLGIPFQNEIKNLNASKYYHRKSQT